MEEQQYKFFKKVKLILTIFAILFVVSMVLTFVFPKDIIFSILSYLFGFLAIIVFVIYIIKFAKHAGMKYRKEMKETRPKRRFKYIDTFYYMTTIPYADADEPNGIQYFIYHILQDDASGKIYAISEQNTNVRFQINSNSHKLLRIDNIDGTTTTKDWKEVNYGDAGSLWIDKEVVGCYQNDGEFVTINYFINENTRLKADTDIHNRNQNYNISLLSNVTFVYGYAEFDAK